MCRPNILNFGQQLYNLHNRRTQCDNNYVETWRAVSPMVVTKYNFEK